MNTVPVASPTNAWVQYVNNKDCSQGFCTLYCPQWCYILFPPPPPFQFPDETSGPNFSPLVITIIGILAATFLLVSYYAIVSNYCIRGMPSDNPENVRDDESSGDDNEMAAAAEPWFIPSNGLDEALIKSITVFEYKKGDGHGSSQGTITDCAVCLSEFNEHDRLRLLPKCNHAFHIPCIDTWLKSHSNCPLCRSNVAPAEPSSSTPPAISAPDTLAGPWRHDGIESADRALDTEMSIDVRDAGEIPAGDLDSDRQPVRRSVSMDCIPDHRLSMGVGDERECECVMKRSHSSGRWLFSKNGRPRNSIFPL